MSHQHLVYLSAGIDPRLNRIELSQRRILNQVLDKVAGRINLQARSPTLMLRMVDVEAGKRIDNSEDQLRNNILRALQMGYGEAGNLVHHHRAAAAAGDPDVLFEELYPDLIDKLTSHTTDFLRDITQDLKDRLYDDFSEGLQDGESNDKLRKRIEAVLGIERNKAKELARTMTQEVFNQAHIARYKEDGVIGVEYVASHGENMCPVCGELDGTVWGINSPDIVRPPVHPWCGCRLLPWLGDELPKIQQVDQDALDVYTNFRAKYFPVPLYA